jgi:hypothetical protein
MRPRVLYVAAWGRSGTTILDNVLDGYPSVFSAGELRYLWQRGLVQRRACGCGQPVAECPVWTKVLAAAFGAKVPDPRHVVRLQRSLRARQAWSLARSPWTPPVEEYAAILGRLYRGIEEVTGAELIVDSSKFPSDAAVLSRMNEVDAYLLHMVRDARAVAHSWSRPTPHPDHPALMRQRGPASSTLNWSAWNLLTESLSRKYGDRYRRLRYEDLVTDPQASFESVLHFAGLPVTDGPFDSPDTVRLASNHTVSGNPRRFSVGTVQIRRDDAWLTQQRTAPRLVATAIGLPYLLRCRYPLWPRASAQAELTER